MKKKEYLLRNRIIGAVLIAVLAQSILFGAVLSLSGGFSVLARLPYQTMRARLQDKSDAVSNTMNQIYLEGAGIRYRVGRETTEKEIHTLLIDVLNKVNYLSGAAYIGRDGKHGVFYVDSEPREYSVKASDITCLIGESLAETVVGMSTKWQREFDGEYAHLRELVAGKESGWFYHAQDASFYYKQYIGGRVFLLQLKAEALMAMPGAEAEEERLQFYLTDGDGRLYAQDADREPMTALEAEEGEPEGGNMQPVGWNDGGVSYVGYREAVGMYGDFQGEETLCAAVLYPKAYVQAPVRTMLQRICTAYVASLVICFLACCSAVGTVLRPLQRMQEDIREQKGRSVRFRNSPAVEIQSIYDALNDMTKRLEESYSRYHMTMEEVGQNIGSFLYHYDTGLTDITDSVEEILCVPKEKLEREHTLTLQVWDEIRAKLRPAPELNAYVFDDGDVERCVSFKTKEEEKGVFGVIMDRTEEYRKISRLRFASEHDFLTKLHNAAYMRGQGEQLLQRNRDRVCAMLFLDLDNLKFVNDSYGHSVGDRYIMAMADRLRACTLALKSEKPEIELIAARMSGDEFAMLLAGFETKEELRDAVLRLYERECSICLPDGKTYPVNSSAGLAYADEGRDTVELLLKCADSAMYSIKSNKKNGIAVYLDETHTEKISPDRA